eukprot:3422781-Prymnesium_polylepis.1
MPNTEDQRKSRLWMTLLRPEELGWRDQIHKNANELCQAAKLMKLISYVTEAGGLRIVVSCVKPQRETYLNKHIGRAQWESANPPFKNMAAAERAMGANAGLTDRVASTPPTSPSGGSPISSDDSEALHTEQESLFDDIVDSSSIDEVLAAFFSNESSVLPPLLQPLPPPPPPM